MKQMRKMGGLSAILGMMPGMGVSREELEGAILTIKDSNGKTVTGAPWTSSKGKTLEDMSKLWRK